MTLPSPLVLLVLLVAAPIVEELAFRGAIQEWILRDLERRYRGESVAGGRLGWLANGVTTALFAAAHTVHRGVWLGIAVLPASLLLGWIYDRRRRLAPCILVHAALNAAWILLATFVQPSALPGF